MVITDERQENASKKTLYSDEKRDINEYSSEGLKNWSGNENKAKQHSEHTFALNSDMPKLMDVTITAMVQSTLDDIIDQAMCEESRSQQEVGSCSIVGEAYDHHMEEYKYAPDKASKMTFEENNQVSKLMQNRNMMMSEGEPLLRGNEVPDELHGDTCQSTKDDHTSVKLMEAGADVLHSNGLNLLAEVALADAEINASTVDYQGSLNSNEQASEYDIYDEYEVLKCGEEEGDSRDSPCIENQGQKSFHEFNYCGACMEKETVVIEDYSSDFLSNSYLQVATDQLLRFDLFPKVKSYITFLIRSVLLWIFIKEVTTINSIFLMPSSKQTEINNTKMTSLGIDSNKELDNMGELNETIESEESFDSKVALTVDTSSSKKAVDMDYEPTVNDSARLDDSERRASDTDEVIPENVSQDNRDIDFTPEEEELQEPFRENTENSVANDENFHNLKGEDNIQEYSSDNTKNCVSNDQDILCLIHRPDEENKLKEPHKQDSLKGEDDDSLCSTTTKIPQGRRIVTRSISSLSKGATSNMSLEEKKRLLTEVRQKKMTLKSSLLKSNLGKITKENTERNKEYRCELNVVVVHKDEPKPPSPTSKMQENMRGERETTTSRLIRNNKSATTSHIPVLKSRGVQKENNGGEVEKYVRWDENLLQISSPQVKSSPSEAKQKPIPKSCLKPTNPATDSLGNILNANESLTPTVKRGVKVTIKQIKYRDEY
ncbi:10407_t:CDS:2 [Acaulospora morrowiae]|uniref:10407_t:CDS:1 n=1 Tax=Acaulospora morrowiae TaxID=94023 RepID=A0A9N8VIM5_9GLOM|nr:10407_t:CDS:2 [Acaulospora morrowiae]